MSVPSDAVTLDDQRAALISDELAQVAGQASGSDGGGGGARRPRVAVAAVVTALVAVLVVRHLSSAPESSTLMFTVTDKGGWVEFAPNPDAETFDAEVAVGQLRDHGFIADSGTYVRWQDPSGIDSIEAPSFGGVPLGGPRLDFADGSQVKISFEAPFDADLPLAADGFTIDWSAAAAQVGMRDPARPRATPGFELRHDSPVTVYVLIAPSAVR